MDFLPKLPGHRHGIAHGANVVHGLGEELGTPLSVDVPGPLHN